MLLPSFILVTCLVNIRIHLLLFTVDAMVYLKGLLLLGLTGTLTEGRNEVPTGMEEVMRETLDAKEGL